MKKTLCFALILTLLLALFLAVVRVRLAAVSEQRQHQQ